MTEAGDDLDGRIIAILQADGRETTRDIAKKTGVSEAVIAARIRWLREQNVMRVILQRDIYSQGYDFQCWVDVYVKGRRVLLVARDIAQLDDVTAVNLLVGKPEISVICHARGRAEMLSLVYGSICTIKGVDQVAVHVALEIHKYESATAELSQRP